MRKDWLKPKYLLFIFISLFASLLYSQDNKDKINDYLTQIKNLNKSTNKVEIAGFESKIAYLYWEEDNLDLAIDHFKKALDLNEAIGNQNAYSIILKNLGLICSEAEKFQDAINYYNKSYSISVKNEDKLSQAEDLINISQNYSGLLNYTQSIDYSLKSLEIYNELNDKVGIKKCYGVLSDTYEKSGDGEKSFEYFNLYSALDKHIQKEENKQKDEENKKKIEQIQTETSIAIKQKEEVVEQLDSSLQLATVDNELKQEEINKLNIQKELDRLKKIEQEQQLKRAASIRNYLLLVLLSILVALSFLYRSNVIKKRTNLKLAQQNAEILHQQDIIAEKNTNINLSIQYAKRIQKALLPQKESFREYFEDSFIYFKPRDEVSGDFYWFSDTNLHTVINLNESDDIKAKKLQLNRNSDDLIISAFDCTGHGVPGAFMSMIGYNLMNEIVGRGINKPDNILNILHKGIRKALRQDKTDNRDGMDVSMCVYRKESQTLEFAGARNPLVYIKNNELIEVKGDRYSIGGIQRSGEDRSFTLHKIKVEEPTYFFVFSDGYQDQIGGSEGKKFLQKNFRQLLLDIYHLPNDMKMKILDEKLSSWIGNDYPQVDDILLIGFKINPKEQN